MNYKPIITQKTIIFELQKPIYGSFYAIWDKWLKIAKEKKLKIVIKVKEGIATFKNTKEYLTGAKKLKRYYKNPNEPMIFYGRDLLVDIKKREKRKKIEKKLEATDGTLMINWLKKIKEKQPERFTQLKQQLSLI